MQLKIFLILFFLANNHLTWSDTWGETIENVHRKVVGDSPSHAYVTSIDDIRNRYNEYGWYNTGLNPVKAVIFTSPLLLN